MIVWKMDREQCEEFWRRRIKFMSKQRKLILVTSLHIHYSLYTTGDSVYPVNLQYDAM